jgi:hypothetical protein
MPIAKALRKFYGRQWRKVTRPRILARAGNCCERCKKPNSVEVETMTGKTQLRSGREYWMFWRDANKKAAAWTDQDGQPAPYVLAEADYPGQRTITVVLTIGHVNHAPGDDRDENLKAWCQWCHLIHDLTHHRETRAARKDQARPLLLVMPERTA